MPASALSKRLRPLLALRLHYLAAAALPLFALSQAAGSRFWPLELFSHFLPHYVLIFFAAALLHRGRKRLLWGTIAIAAGIWLLLPHPAALPPDPAAPWRLMWYNVHLDNPAPQAETGFILQQRPQMLALAEIDTDHPGWQGLRQHYPHGCTHQESSPFALAFWSTQPLAQCEVRFSGNFPYIRAQTADGSVIYALHPPPPVNSELARARMQYLQHSAADIAAEQTDTIAVGDFNSSPFSPLMRRFLKQSRLHAYQPNWLPGWRPFYLNIDHALATRPLSIRALPWQHSDHRALLVQWAKPH